ncbi:MAG: response regulator transcription factor [Woeseiaceae bacterium]
MNESARILVVEDNEDLAFGLRTNLEVQGYEVLVAGDGPSGLCAAEEQDPDLIILDLMLPKLGGIDVLKSLRRHGASMPILILTAKGSEVDKVNGLRLGADDYVTKPFGLMELIARVEALLRRATQSTATRFETAGFGDIEIDFDSRQVTRRGAPVDLTPKEFGLLVALLKREGAVASRLELMSEVWGHSSAVISRTVDTHVAELRRKLEQDPARPKHILTVRKTGYRLDS